MESCRLCGCQNLFLFHKDRQRPYYRCQVCHLISVPKSHWLTEFQEKAIYDKHQNDVESADYRHFLSRTFNPVIKKIPPEAKGLDFGCGPGPALCAMFMEAGYPMKTYDKFYAPTQSVLEETYDFITMTEVIEHLGHPACALQKLYNQLNLAGFLAIMTKRVTSLLDFSSWHYKNDTTHIAFYCRETFHYVAQLFGMSVEFPDRDLVIFQKK